MEDVTQRAVAATRETRWQDVYSTCLEIAAGDGADDTFARILSDLSPSEATSFLSVARDATGHIQSPMGADGAEAFACIMGMSFTTRDGLPLSRSEIAAVARCVEEFTDGEEVVLLPHAFSPCDLDVSPTVFARLSHSFQAKWIGEDCEDPWDVIRSTFGRGRGPMDPVRLEVGVLIGARLERIQTYDEPEECYLDLIPEADTRSDFCDLVVSSVPRIASIDFPTTIGRCLPDAMLRDVINEACLDAMVATGGNAGSVVVSHTDGLTVLAFSHDGELAARKRYDAGPTGLDDAAVSDLIEEALPTYVGVMSSLDLHPRGQSTLH
jgi:hypothetical protein